MVSVLVRIRLFNDNFITPPEKIHEEIKKIMEQGLCSVKNTGYDFEQIEYDKRDLENL
jgi:hypothetical protein